MKKVISIFLCAIIAMAGHSQELLWQQCNESLPLAKRIMPVRCMDNNHQGGEDVKATVDDNPSTIYHSAYYPTKKEVTPDNPVELIYDFEDVERIDYLGYAPRQDGGSNGLVNEAEIYVKTGTDTDYRLYQHCQWPINSDVKRVFFTNGLIHPVSIKVRFLRGLGDFASCSEMLFMEDANQEWGLEIFDDDLYTNLKPTVTDEEIERIEIPVFRELARQLKDGTYSKAFRVGTYECYDSPQWLSSQWKTPGKYYDHLQGVTGIAIEPGKHMIVVRDLPDTLVARLNVVAWYTGLTGRNFDGGNPQIESFYLHNGVNIIDYDGPWTGLAYIAYFSDGGAEANPPIRVHFVGGTVNGFLTPEMTNEQMHEMTATAPSRFIDVVGRKVHAVWTSAGMHEFCKADDGKSPGYRQYMNILDTLMIWEQRVVGLEKYGRIPRNRTLLYVNFSFGSLFQWTLGISAHIDNERLYLNCRSLLYEDSETMWGVGHEWGHQHQLSPNFCWAGVSEVTNNLNAYYNLMHMGYRYEQLHPEKRQGIDDAIKH